MSSRRLVNYTPHPVHFYRTQEDEKPYCTIPSAGTVRVKSYPQTSRGTARSDDGEGIPCIGRQEFYALDAPSGYDKVVFGGGVIVSMAVAQYLDANPSECKCAVFVPATGPAHGVRDDKGGIKGTTALERWK